MRAADLWILDRATNEARRVRSGRGQTPASWSPDGGRLLFNVVTSMETSEMHVVRFDGTDETPLELAGHGLLTRADWTGDHRIVGANEFLGAPGSLYEVDLATAETRQLIPTLERRLGSRSTSARGEIVQMDETPGPPATGRVWVARADGTGKPRLLATILRGSLYYAEWSPDGRRLALVVRFYKQPNRLVVLRTGSSTAELTAGSGIGGEAPVWSPDGKKLAYLAGPGRGDLWIADANGEHWRQLTRTREAEYPIAWLAAPEPAR